MSPKAVITSAIIYTSETWRPGRIDRPKVSFEWIFRELAGDVDPSRHQVDAHANSNGHDGNEPVSPSKTFSKVEHMDTGNDHSSEEEGSHATQDAVGYGQDNGCKFSNDAEEHEPRTAGVSCVP